MITNSIFSPTAIVISCLLLTTCVSPTTVPEQTQDQSLLRIYEINLKPESVDAWTALQRDEAIPVMLAGGYDWVEVWGSAGAGDVFYRSLIMPISNLNELDEPAIFSRTMGQEKAQDLLQRNNAMVNSINALIVRTRTDLSFGTPPANPGVGVLTKVTIANGRTEEFERRLRGAVASELRESNVRSFRVSQVLYGGDPNQYFALLEFEDLPNDELIRTEVADRGHPTPMEWAMGSVGLARVAEQPNSPVISINRVVLSHIEELSSR